ncbi:S8 family serine peptidase [Calditrichota bacterium]
MRRSTFRYIVAIFLVASLPVLLLAGSPDWNADYRKGVVNIKVTPDNLPNIPADGASQIGIYSIDEIMVKYQVERFEPSFPNADPPLNGGVDVRLWITATFPEHHSLKEICEDLKRLAEVQYAEPWFVHNYCYDYSDTYVDDQWGFEDYLDCDDAHDISTGDPGTIVGIIDSGCDMEHSDLDDNYWINPGEDINEDGVIDDDDYNNEDDDNNGYVDDFWGWDRYSQDNNPDDTYGHGSHCAGIACAETDNDRGVASPGFNCSIMVYRAGGGVTVDYGYAGIYYCADNGAQVISMSWGNNQYSNQGQDIINYAYERDVMIFAATGNDYSNQEFYPAAYENVISVAATTTGDRKADFSNYGDWVDCSAPGTGILSTVPNNSYGYMQGTSMACPMAAGVGALIRATYPRLSNDEAMELLYEGCEDARDDGLGVGRVNAYKSLLAGQLPAVTLGDLIIIEDGNDNLKFDVGEKVKLAIEIENLEDAVDADSVFLLMYTNDASIELLQDQLVKYELNAGDTYFNEEEPFELEISDEAYDHTFWLTIEATSYPGEIWASRTYEIVIGHPDFLIVDDDDGDELELWYYAAVEGMKKGWVRYDIAANDYEPPSDSLLLAHDVVLWNTGNANPPLDPYEKANIEVGIFFGANILLAGKNIGDDEDNLEFLEEVFGAEHQEDAVAALFVDGLAGEGRPLDEDARMLLLNNGAPGANDSNSSMLPANDNYDSLAVYKKYENQEYIPTGLAGVYGIDEYSEARTVYLGFGIEGIGTGSTSRHDFLKQVSDWMRGIERDIRFDDLATIPSAMLLNPAYPNPFNSTVSLNLSLPTQQQYELSVFDVSGRKITTLMNSVKNPGNYRAVWNAEGVPAGIYFARLTATGAAQAEQRLVLIK